MRRVRDIQSAVDDKVIRGLVTERNSSLPGKGSTKAGGSMLTRGLALLAAYRAGELELSQTELAKRTGLPKPTVHRLVAELVEWGALERSRTGVRLGQWLYLLGVSAPRIGLLRAVGQSYLDRLCELTHEYVCLSVLCGDEALDIASAGAMSWWRGRHDTRPGTMSRAAARALVADATEPGVFTAQAPIGRPAPGMIPEPRSGGPAPRRLLSVAVPVIVFGHPVAAVSVVGLAGGFDARAAATTTQATVTAFARKLALTEIFGEQLSDGPLRGETRPGEFHAEKHAVPEFVGGTQNEAVR